MGWFDEQLQKRQISDQELFEDSLLTMASAILGSQTASEMSNDLIVTKQEIDEILKYYHKKPSEIPASITETWEQLEYALRPYGLMYRKVTLKEGWLKDAYGPMLVFRKEDDKPEALFPRAFGGYYYRSPDGRRRKLTKQRAEEYKPDAICFYKPLPLKPLGIKDLMLYLWSCLSVSDVVFLVILTLLVVCIGRLMPFFQSMLTGFVVRTRNVTLLLGTAVFMFSTIVSSQLLSVARELAMTRLNTKTSLGVEAAMMMRLISLPAPFFRKYSSGELSSRSQAVNQLSDLLVAQVFSTGLTSICSLLYLTQIHRFAPALFVPAILTILATVIVILITIFLQMSVTKKRMEYGAKESGMSFSLINGVQKVKLAGAEKRAFSKWAEVNAQCASYAYNPPFFLKISTALTTLVSVVGLIALYYSATVNQVTPSAYMGFNSAYGMVMGAFTALAGVAASLAQIKPILEMAEPILKTVPENTEDKEIVTSVTGGIEFNHVSFRYNENMPYVVNDLSLRIKAGEYIALVGRTGCGKSTLMRLLLGFETPEKGSIYYDGKDLKGLDLRSLRRKIGAVTQDGSLFQGDIYSNIVISAPQLTIAEAWEAAETAGIAEDIRMMPMGMATVISEGSGGISGGQKQRLMIARAIAPKPKILMFDEATSALDNRTQKRVADALDKLNCTRLVIAHRLSTIRNCDRILVLDEGKIREDGTYDELIAKGGYFAELVARQRLDLGNA